MKKTYETPEISLLGKAAELTKALNLNNSDGDNQPDTAEPFIPPDPS